MEITPPVSPSDSHDRSDNDILRKRGSYGFHCVGEPRRTVMFDPHGFLLNGEGDYRNALSKDMRLKQPFCHVFEHLHDIDGSHPEYFERLFRICRNKICILDSAQKANVGTYGFLGGSLSEPTANFDKIRQQLREFFIMLRMFLHMQSNDNESVWVLEKTLPTIVKGLSLIRTQLGWLTDLPSHVLSHAYVKSGSNVSEIHTYARASTSFHLFHCHLEMRWLYISVLCALDTCMYTSPKFEATQVSDLLQRYFSESSIHGLLQSAIQLCVVDLIDMAVAKFNKLNHEVIVKTSLYNCMCVKELWLLLRHVTESSHQKDVKSFWKLLDGLLELLVKDENNSHALKKGFRPLILPNQITCVHPHFFSLWLFHNIVELFTYSADGVPLNSVGAEIESGQLSLKRILSNITSSSDMDESQRRVLVSLVRCLMKEPWKPKPEPIMMLWEGFCRNLDCAFQLPGALPSSYAIPSDTIKDILDSVDFSGIIGSQQKSLNSFDMFLCALGAYLAQDPSQWKLKMCGRFCSKLSEKKVSSLNEIGLFHLTQLFLTIASCTDLENLALLFQKLVRFHDRNEERNAMVMKAQLCFVSLFAQAGKPLSPLISQITEAVDLFLSNNQVSVAQVFVENLSFIANSNDSLPSDLHVVCGEWMKNFLRIQNSRPESVRKLLRVVVEIMKKVLSSSDTAVGGGIEKLVYALHENVLPFVKEQKRCPWEEIADLAVYFTLTALQFQDHQSCQDSYQSLLHHFMISDASNVVLVRRYLQSILLNNKIQHIVEVNESQQIVFVQAWVRCCTLSSSSDYGIDKEVTKKMLMIPLLKSMTKDPLNLDGMHHTWDPLIHLFETLGNNTTLDKKAFAVLIEPLKLLVPMLKSSLFPTKSKDVSWKNDKNGSLEFPKEVIVRSIYVFGKLTCDCCHLIYEKNTSNFLITLINNLVIPTLVLDMDVRLPLPMDEGLRKSLHLYLQGLCKLDPNKDVCIQRLLNQIVEIYVPRFGVVAHTDPFRKIWDEPEHMSFAIQIIQRVCETLLQLDTKSNLPHKYYVQGLHLINDLIKSYAYDEVLLNVLIVNVFPKCLLIASRATDLSGSTKRQEVGKTLKLMFEAEAYLVNANLWEETNNVLNQLSERYLSFSAESFMRMLYFLKKDFRIILKRFLPKLESNIKKVIAKRGSGTDKNLEAHLAKLKAGING